MTTNAPERIWAATPADGEMKPETMYGWTTEEHVEEWRLDNQAEIELGCDDPLAYVEYIRADLSPSPEVVKELVEALRDIADGTYGMSMACVAARAALEAAPVPDLVEAGKVLEGVTPGPWVFGIDSEVLVDGECDMWIAVGPADYDAVALAVREDFKAESEVEANARFIAWCREGVPALIALATAQAAQIAGLTKERDDLQEKMKLERFLTDRATILAGTTQDEAATLRAEVERLRGALQIARVHVANNAEGWSVSRAAARVDLTIVDAAITEATQ